MNKRLLIIAFLTLSLILLGSAQNIIAGTVFVRVGVGYDVEDRQVGGFAATYVTYDLYDYYDPGAAGILFYTNPTNQIDQDAGIGVNDYLYWYYPGYKADFTTSNYQSNRVLCTFGEHGLLKLFTPTPLQWSDPYQIDSITAQQYGGDYDLYIPEYLYSEESYSAQQYRVVATSLICTQTPPVVPSQTPTPTPTPAGTPTVLSVEFQSTATSNVTNDNPANLGGGQRIFPDRQTPQDNENRRTVRVRAQLGDSGGVPANTSGVRVYFRNFDVDDPSDDPIIDSGGNAGNDNNGTFNGLRAGKLSIDSALTNSSGEASVELTVTMQPGDNFVVAASTDSNYLNGVTVSGTGLQDSAGSQLSTSSGQARRTEMLSVWRRLHIEVDSMGAAQQNFVLGTITQSATLRSGQQETLLVSQPLEVNRFENGRIEINTRSYDVVSNTVNTVTIQVERNGSISADSMYQLFDDDDFNDDDGPYPGDGTLDGDTGENINQRMPDTALLTANSDDPNSNVFASAYVHPVYDVVDPRDNNIFQANADGDAATDIRPLFVDWDSSSTNKADDFWSVYLLGSYQHTLDEDRDPSTEDLTLGIVDEITRVTGDLEGSGALIFTEGHRSRELPGYNPAPTSLNSMAVTVAHEVGHLFSCIHGDGGLLGTDPLRGTPVSNQLSPRMIFKIRGLMHP